MAAGTAGNMAESIPANIPVNITAAKSSIADNSSRPASQAFSLARGFNILAAGLQ